MASIPRVSGGSSLGPHRGAVCASCLALRSQQSLRHSQLRAGGTRPPLGSGLGEQNPGRCDSADTLVLLSGSRSPAQGAMGLPAGCRGGTAPRLPSQPLPSQPSRPGAAGRRCPVPSPRPTGVVEPRVTATRRSQQPHVKSSFQSISLEMMKVFHSFFLCFDLLKSRVHVSSFQTRWAHCAGRLAAATCRAAWVWDLTAPPPPRLQHQRV